MVRKLFTISILLIFIVVLFPFPCLANGLAFSVDIDLRLNYPSEWDSVQETQARQKLVDVLNSGEQGRRVDVTFYNKDGKNIGTIQCYFPDKRYTEMELLDLAQYYHRITATWPYPGLFNKDGPYGAGLYTYEATFLGYTSSRRTIQLIEKGGDLDYQIKQDAIIEINLADYTRWRIEYDEEGQPIGVDDSPWSSYWGDSPSDDTIIAKLFTRFIKSILWSLWKFFGLQDPVTLFFDVDPKVLFADEVLERANIDSDSNMESWWTTNKNSLYVDPNDSDTFLYMFSLDEHRLIGTIFKAFEKVLQIPYVIGIAIVGFMIFIGGFNSEDRSRIKMLVGGIFMFPLMIKVFPVLIEPIFWANYAIVSAVGATAVNAASDLFFPNPLTTPFVSILIGSGTSMNSVGVIIATACLFILAAILNFQYFVRRFMIAILLIMFPVVAFLQIFPTNKQVFRLWVSEFLANIFMQSAHAIVYVLFLLYVFGAQLPFVPIIAMLVTLATMTSFVRSLMGCRSAGGFSGIAGGMLGISAMMGAGRIAGKIVEGVGSARRPYSTEAPENTSGSTAGISGSPIGSSDGISDGSSDGSLAAPSSASISADPASSVETTEASGSSLSGSGETGPVWGMKPRVEPVKILPALGSLAAKGAVLGMMAGGMMVGGAALGPAGVGIGAAAGARASAPLVAAGGYGMGIAQNYVARNKVLSDIMQENPGMSKKDAIIFAATGVKANYKEIRCDEEMYGQYVNFTDIAGLSSLRKEIDTPSDFERDVRQRAHDTREQYMRSHPDAPMQDVNNYVLNEAIRPSFISKGGINAYQDVYDVYSIPFDSAEEAPDPYENMRYSSQYPDSPDPGINNENVLNAWKEVYEWEQPRSNIWEPKSW